jgi:hypothetical protein
MGCAGGLADLTAAAVPRMKGNGVATGGERCWKDCERSMATPSMRRGDGEFPLWQSLRREDANDLVADIYIPIYVAIYHLLPFTTFLSHLPSTGCGNDLARPHEGIN